jgi:hypothetical protein
MKSVYCGVRNASYNKTVYASSLKVKMVNAGLYTFRFLDLHASNTSVDRVKGNLLNT